MFRFARLYSNGVCPELAPGNLPEDWFTGGSYTMVTEATADCPSAVRELVPEEQLILIAFKGSLETSMKATSLAPVGACRETLYMRRE